VIDGSLWISAGEFPCIEAYPLPLFEFADGTDFKKDSHVFGDGWDVTDKTVCGLLPL